MFVRFRKTPNRLQVSILEAHRAVGKVTNEHIASLGSIELSMSVGSRQAFWAYLWDRLASLSNRIGADDQAKIRNAVHARIPMVMPEEANADEAAYWEKYSAVFVEKGARHREDAAEAIKRAELTEGVAAVFAENRTAALKGERPMERVVVGELLAPGGAKPTPDGTPIIMANGEPGIYRAPKRPDRNDRRRRRNGHRFTPEPIKGWKQYPFGQTWRVATSDEIDEMITSAAAERAAEETDTE
jgi:hypothetical protein